MPTLILSARYTADGQALWRAAIQRGWWVQRVSGWRVPVDIRKVAEPVLYTEALVGPLLAEQFGLTLPDPPPDWLPSLPEEYRKRRISLSTLGQARLLKEPAFIKPPNDKSFAARVYAPSELPTDFPDDTPVLISEVVEWESEFRCFILDRSLRTFSIYLRHGELQVENDYACTENEEAELQSFVLLLLADKRVELLRATVVDVGMVRGRGWAVVEQNSAWGAGLYGCDPGEALEVIRHAACSG